VRAYTLRIEKQAKKTLLSLEARDRRRIVAALELLRRTPIPPAATKLTNRPGYRIRVGEFRILYTVTHTTLTVVVIALGHRKDVYR